MTRVNFDPDAASRSDLVERIGELENAVEYKNEEISELQDRVDELESVAEDRGHIAELVAIRDDLRADRHGVALDRITRWLDQHAECWRTMAPAYQPSQHALLGGES